MLPLPNNIPFSFKHINEALPTFPVTDRTQSLRSSPSFRGRTPTRMSRTSGSRSRSRSRDKYAIIPINKPINYTCQLNNIIRPTPIKPCCRNRSFHSLEYARDSPILDSFGAPLPIPPSKSTSSLDVITNGMRDICFNVGAMVPYSNKNTIFFDSNNATLKLCQDFKGFYNETPNAKIN